ncbi:hypothetical protein GMMP13_1040008 [Candidatus Magnetomoraceae bacterium gMMP-13]
MSVTFLRLTHPSKKGYTFTVCRMRLAPSNGYLICFINFHNF